MAQTKNTSWKQNITVQRGVNELTPLLNVAQNCVQMWFKFMFNQFQTKDSDGAQCIVQVVCLGWKSTYWHTDS